MVTYVSNFYPALECDDSMVFVVSFGGLGNVLLETYKEEGLEARGMNMKMKMIRDFFKFDATL